MLCLFSMLCLLLCCASSCAACWLMHAAGLHLPNT
ncbi:uncharacterized protein RAG0_16302 [Rhynchosporium agropyri]|uniref:Uncharacterized protein n=1 Tax=Rhynchosporium agropyri TaxID=914238 RepID=A0A1E1LPS0_9HELO|nr:uncharacterized protein RAG0_16302 [Rhynchosporium agropyri]